MAQSPLNDTTQPVDSEEEGRSPTTDGRRLIKKEKKLVVFYTVKEVMSWPKVSSLVFQF